MQHFDRIYRSAAKLHADANRFGSSVQNSEQSDFRIGLALYRASDIQNVWQALDLNCAVHAKIRARPGWQCAIEADIHGHGTIHHSGINSGYMSFGGAVVCVNRGL